MLTLFTIPKAFRGHFKVIQTNAIRSWTLLQPRPEIVLLGDDEGTAEIASELRLCHIPEVKRNEYGTPLVNSVFEEAERTVHYPLMCYVNADIILMSDFITAVKCINEPLFLMSGRRWDLDIKEPIDFSIDWEQKLHEDIAKKGKPHGCSGIDCFVFPRNFPHNLPAFAVGRPGWDNWLIYHIRSLRIPVIDATKVISLIHQNHDYSHHSEGEYGVWKGQEAQYNLSLAGGYHYLYTLKDATHELTKKGLRPNRTVYSFYRKFVTSSVSSPFCKLIYKLWRKFSDIVRS